MTIEQEHDELIKKSYEYVPNGAGVISVTKTKVSSPYLRNERTMICIQYRYKNENFNTVISARLMIAKKDVGNKNY